MIMLLRNERKLRILVIGEEIGELITGFLIDNGYYSTVLKVKNRLSEISEELKKEFYDVLILTNNGLTPDQISVVIPVVKNVVPKIIVMSGYYRDDLINHWKALGAYEFLPMPFRVNVLGEKLKILFTK
jgi:DNA-binding NtrC family response regulator